MYSSLRSHWRHSLSRCSLLASRKKRRWEKAKQRNLAGSTLGGAILRVAPPRIFLWPPSHQRDGLQSQKLLHTHQGVDNPEQAPIRPALVRQKQARYSPT